MIDDTDRRLLRALQRDGSLSAAALAEATGIAQTSVWRRVRALEATGLLTGRVALVDPQRAGLSVCTIVQVNIAGHSPETRAAFEAFVRASDPILHCYAVSGSQDYTLIVRTPTVEAYERFLMDTLLAQDSVAATATQLVLRQVKATTALPL